MLSSSNEGEAVLLLAKRLLAAERDSEHFRAVQALCAFATEAYTGVLQVAAAKNGIAAQSLCRTLFEAAVNAVILAKHPEKLEDFKKHGRLTTLQGARSIPVGSQFESPKLKALRDATEAECNALYAYFKPTGNWHLLGTTDAFAEAELPENMRGRYYVRASAIAHGHPYPVVQNYDKERKAWMVQACPEEWERWAETARVMSMLLMVHMIGRLSSVFALGLESEIAAARQQVEGIAQEQMQAARRPPD